MPVFGQDRLPGKAGKVYPAFAPIPRQARQRQSLVIASDPRPGSCGPPVSVIGRRWSVTRRFLNKTIRKLIAGAARSYQGTTTNLSRARPAPARELPHGISRVGAGHARDNHVRILVPASSGQENRGVAKIENRPERNQERGSVHPGSPFRIDHKGVPDTPQGRSQDAGSAYRGHGPLLPGNDHRH